MRISAIKVSGFRGLDVEVPIAGPLGLLAGANNAGKSTVIDALRAVMQPYTGQSGKYWIAPGDFTRATASCSTASEITITVSVSDIASEHRGQMLSVLSPSVGAGTARITLKARMDSSGRVKTAFYGGDLDGSEVEAIARDAIRFVYLPPLRDAVADLRPGQANRLPALVSTYAPDGHADREEIVEIAKDANSKLAKVEALVNSAKAIQQRLTGMTGKGPYAHYASLQFSDPRYERVLATLQALAGASSHYQLGENGLGYNNLVYIAVLLAAIESDESVPLNVLLVEEPEAHLHPQLQTLLMEYLDSQSGGRTQVIATSHSAQFASSASIARVTVLRRAVTDASPTAHGLSGATLDRKQSRHLRRFLDVTKSALLFSAAVILVEGVAEQLVLPALAHRLGISLSQHGISVVSVDGVSFEPFVRLFNKDGLPMRCAVVSDSDPYFDENGNLVSQSATATIIAGFESGQVKVELADTTFEWDIAFANFTSQDLLLDAVADVRPIVGKRLRNQSFTGASDFADEVLTAVEEYKGPFAQALADRLWDGPGRQFVVPDYLTRAVQWVT